jgi:hypothetical protein
MMCLHLADAGYAGGSRFKVHLLRIAPAFTKVMVGRRLKVIVSDLLC